MTARPAQADGGTESTPDDATLGELEQRVSALLDELNSAAADVAPDDAGRDALRHTIVDLYRRLDAHVERASALRASVRHLAYRWRTGAATGRVDHLGASTFVEKGWSKLSVGDAIGAEAALVKALELAPETLEGTTLLAWALAEQRRHDDALIVAFRVISRDVVAAEAGTQALARAVAGLVCTRKGAYRDAADLLRAALRQGNAASDSRATSYAQLFLGMLSRVMGHPNDAMRAFGAALDAGPNLLQARYELGRTQWLVGDRDAAMRTWRDGAGANRFNVWGRRCGETLEIVTKGGEPPPAE